jgi:aminoglycoside phosphotransferase (APT) family kinase protein
MSCTIERTEEGSSTQVYRLRRGAEVFYLRVAEEREASLGPEARVHEMLQARGVRVPIVIHFEPFNERLERSLLVTTEIRGESVLCRTPDAATAAILRAAGRDLAAINSIPIEGFGWIRRDNHTATMPQAEHPSNRAFMLEHLDHDLEQLPTFAFSKKEVDTIRAIIVACDAWLDADQAYLAHGDFDLTHIYQCDGEYTGIIDFGEIRGTAPLYDLGHFRLHDGERMAPLLLAHLIEGYGEGTPLSPDYEREIAFVSMLIGVRALARALRPGDGEYTRYLQESIRKISAILHG